MTVWNRFLLRNSFMPYLVLLLGLAMSGAGALWKYRAIEQDAIDAFQRLSQRTATEVAARFHQPIYGLNGAAAAYAAMKQMRRAEFRAYVGARDLAREFPGVRGFGFIQKVMRTDVDAFVAQERADDAPDFELHQLADTSQDDLYVIKYIEPLASNAPALGLDIGSEAVRRAGVQQAVDTGQPTVSGAITLVQDAQKTPGMLLFIPVYAAAMPLNSEQERQQALTGLLYAPLVIADLLAQLPDVETGQVDFEIYDSPVNAPNGSLIFDADNHVASQTAAGRSADAGRKFSSRHELFLPGRELTISMNSTPQFDAAIDHRAPWFMLLGGALISTLLALLMYQQTTGRKRAEIRARAMTSDLNRLAEVVRHTDNAVSTADVNSRITWVNEGFTRLTGYSLAEALGKTPAELLGSGKADAYTLQKLTDAAQRGVSCRVEILNRAKDGREYWTDTEIQPQHDADGQHMGFMEIGIDVTERKRMQTLLESSLRENDALLSALNLHAIISSADRTGAILEVNDAFCDISGYTREELIGSDHRIVRSGEHPPVFWEDVWKTITTGMPWRGDICNKAKDGHLYWVDTFIAPFIGDDGQIDKYISIRIDITTSKAAERLLHKATEEAKAASQSKSQFLANMSHEIRTPMNAVLGMLTLLRKTDLTPKQADYAAKSEGAARSLLGLINEILDFSKIEAGKMTLDPYPFDLQKMLGDLSVILTPSVGNKPVSIAFEVDPQAPRYLLGDAMRIQQVLLNLGSNAIKFTPQGEVRLSISVVHRSADAVSLQFSMRDSGIGIAPENQARIFSGFTQAESSTTRRFGGTGLGVVISQRFVQMMGGELELQSALGEGSRFYFTVTLPLAEAPVAQADDPSQAGALRLQGMRLLLVEDNLNNQQIACELLQGEGASVHVANHGQEGVDAVADAPTAFDVVLMDLQMPVMDGMAATRHIRTVLGLATLPIVAMTANAMASDREACLEAGMNDHVGKPFDLNDLVRVLRKQAQWTDAEHAAADVGGEVAPMVLQAAATAGVDLQSALHRIGGKQDVYRRMLATFVKDLAAMPGQLQDCAAQADAALAKRLLHTLKGLAATLGASALSVQAAQGEKQLGSEAHAEVLTSVCAHASAAIDQAHIGLQTLLAALQHTHDAQASSATVAAPAVDTAALQSALQAMVVQLRESDMQAMLSMATLEQQYGEALGESLSPLQDAMAEMDFEKAVVDCQQLLNALITSQNGL